MWHTKISARLGKKIEPAPELQRVIERYRDYPVEPLSYGTVRDYCDSFDHLHALATANGDLKDCQRPWVLKAVLAKVPRPGKVLEIGAGEPLVADLLSRMGYETWIVDPYNGSGNGPTQYDQFRRAYPHVKFVRAEFSDRLTEIPEHGFDCIYSISVLEHVSANGLRDIFSGLKRFLKPMGFSIHAVDHVSSGNGAVEHLCNLRFMAEGFGFDLSSLEMMLSRMTQDTETYYLSAESHNRWRADVPYDDFPMRVCVSIQFITDAVRIGNAVAAI
jgi:2-polyprenyl-3-methyl-5-hydroxy-6-metoxy-1,4-benzoquinol methylase